MKLGMNTMPLEAAPPHPCTSQFPTIHNTNMAAMGDVEVGVTLAPLNLGP
jgi:hypothetical protein